ncbi:MAG: hypothetical protein KAI40_08170 [Desulfobacterales bacterium]|nr:hypothetical protein [Desulfobacterales bacterium]
MGKTFRIGDRETKLLSKIESSKERERMQILNSIREDTDTFSNKIAMKLIEQGHIETVSKNSIQEQLEKCLTALCKAEDFDIDYQVAPLRGLVSNPNIASLYVTAFVIENLINHKDVVDIYGSDEEIYFSIKKEITQLVHK